jgi:N-acyl homoserine lactone hydrolase
VIPAIDPDDRVVRLSILDFGLFRVHSGPRVIGICGYLMQTEKGRNLLVDTGFPAKYAHDSEKASKEDHLGEFGAVVSLTPENLPEAQLTKLGVAPEDVHALILTHTHIDHVGGIGDYPHAPLVIGAAERVLPKPLYWKKAQPLDWPDVETITIDRDTDVCRGLRLLSTPGHSPGHLSLMLDLPRTGPVLLAADAISRPSEVEERFAGSWNEAQALDSALRILAMAEEAGAMVVYGHSPEQWPMLRKAPGFYD